MEASVLVLSSTFQPIAMVGWKDAMTMIFSDRAEVVASYEDKVVHSGNGCAWPVPSIIRFLTRASARFFSRSVRFTRKNVWIRDGGTCQYCGKAVALSDFTYDHVLARSSGGKTVWENIVVSCVPCNQKKGEHPLSKVGMTLRSKPVKPKSLPSSKADQNLFVWREDYHHSWRDYMVSDAYWNSPLDK
jgi:5-methylcytosine-specific restriction endonuclease McrA